MRENGPVHGMAADTPPGARLYVVVGWAETGALYDVAALGRGALQVRPAGGCLPAYVAEVLAADAADPWLR